MPSYPAFNPSPLQAALSQMGACGVVRHKTIINDMHGSHQEPPQQHLQLTSCSEPSDHAFLGAQSLRFLLIAS